MPASFSTVVLENDRLRVVVEPDNGARVVSLVDRNAGREWLAGPTPEAPTSAEGVYSLAEASGWDECFPTVSPCADPHDSSAPRLRDHGDLWGRPWTVERASGSELLATFAGGAFEFSRRLELRGADLVASYAARSLAEAPRAVLWAMHPLFALRPGERIELPGAQALDATFLAGVPGGGRPRRIAWPGGDGVFPFSLDAVQPPAAGKAFKAFVAGPQREARIVGREGELAMRWSGVESCGLWATYGFWPTPNQLIHVAIEPTTSPDDTLESAVSNGRARKLLPGETARWFVTLSVA